MLSLSIECSGRKRGAVRPFANRNTDFALPLCPSVFHGDTPKDSIHPAKNLAKCIPSSSPDAPGEECQGERFLPERRCLKGLKEQFLISRNPGRALISLGLDAVEKACLRERGGVGVLRASKRTRMSGGGGSATPEKRRCLPGGILKEGDSLQDRKRELGGQLRRVIGETRGGQAGFGVHEMSERFEKLHQYRLEEAALEFGYR